jgi:hypothetical protein
LNVAAWQAAPTRESVRARPFGLPRLKSEPDQGHLATLAHLDFERAISEVEEQIDRLQDLARERGLDVSAELRSLERKLHSLKREVYETRGVLTRSTICDSLSPISSSSTVTGCIGRISRSSAAGRGSKANR